MLVTITGERIPGADEGGQQPETAVGAPPKPVVASARVPMGTWIYVLAAGLFAMFAFAVSAGF